MEREGERRSARILALQEKARANKQKQEEAALPATNVNKNKRGRCKGKGFKDVVRSSLASSSSDLQDDQSSGSEDVGLNLDQPSSSRRPSRLPTKEVLEFILDVLQKRDKEEIFAQPIDLNQVGYNNLVRGKSMDFGTMRAKLQEGMYTSLKQFKDDVRLIYSNAMDLHQSDSSVHKTARDISEHAERLFNKLLRSEQKTSDLAHLGLRKRKRRKPENQVVRSDSEHLGTHGRRSRVGNTFQKRRDDIQLSLSAPSTTVHSRSGSFTWLRGRQTAYLRPESGFCRDNSIVSPLNDMPKVLSLVPSTFSGSYEKSLNRFIEGLGPTARKVADMKLKMIKSVDAQNTPLWASTGLGRTVALTIPPPTPSPSAAHEHIDLNRVGNNFWSSSNREMISTNALFNIASSSSGALNFSKFSGVGGLNLTFPNSSRGGLNLPNSANVYDGRSGNASAAVAAFEHTNVTKSNPGLEWSDRSTWSMQTARQDAPRSTTPLIMDNERPNFDLNY